MESLSDDLYHLLEYYVHSDAPLSCHLPTVPLDTTPSEAKSKKKEKEKDNDDDDDDEKEKEKKKKKKEQEAEGGSNNNAEIGNKDHTSSDLEKEHPYTPFIISVQGTLQKSHLHIWTDMNVIMHSIGSTAQVSKKVNSKKPGFVVAGTAYSLPEYDGSGAQQQQQQQSSTGGGSSSEGNKKIVADDAAVIRAARDPWTPGHGTKVIRGEPLTFTFHVGWIVGADGIRWPSSAKPAKSGFITAVSSSSSSSSSSSFFGNLVFFALAAGVGALAAVYWDRYRSAIVTTYNRGRRRNAGRGEGILGAPSTSPSPGIMYGNGNGYGGYGGYSASRDLGAVGNGGYGGYGIGKRD